MPARASSNRSRPTAGKCAAKADGDTHVVTSPRWRSSGVIAISADAVVAGGARYVRSLLFEVTPFDTRTLAGAVVVMFAVALGAAYVPARRAARLDPLRALREE